MLDNLFRAEFVVDEPTERNRVAKELEECDGCSPVDDREGYEEDVFEDAAEGED